MMMKKLLIASAMLAAVAGANAQSSAGFGVTGTVTPGACSVTLSGGGLADYGTQTQTTVQALAVSSGAYGLGNKAITIGITCTAPTRVELAIVDNKKSAKLLVGDAYDSIRFGISDGAGTTGIGHYDLYAASNDYPLIDGVAIAGAVNAITGNSTGWSTTFPSGAPATSFSDGYAIGFIKTAGAVVPSAFTTLSGRIYINASVSKSYVDATTSSIKLNGSGTMTLQYL